MSGGPFQDRTTTVRAARDRARSAHETRRSEFARPRIMRQPNPHHHHDRMSWNSAFRRNSGFPVLPTTHVYPESSAAESNGDASVRSNYESPESPEFAYGIVEVRTVRPSAVHRLLSSRWILFFPVAGNRMSQSEGFHPASKRRRVLGLFELPRVRPPRQILKQPINFDRFCGYIGRTFAGCSSIRGT